MTWLITPLNYEFMQRGLAAAVMVGIICAVVGCYVVLRSMAFLGDALAHAILPGVAVAYLLGTNLTLGALIAAIVVALGIGYLSRGGIVREDTAIGIVFAAALSLGVALMSSIRTYAVDLSHILFGNVLAVGNTDLWLTAGLGTVVLALIAYFYKEFMAISFDPILSATIRLPVNALRNLMLIILAVTIVISMQTVGIGLVAAMLLAAEPWPQPNPSAWIGWAYLVIAGSVISFTSYVIAVRTLPITVVTTYAYVNPVIAVLLGRVALAERITSSTLLGMVLILAGVAGVFRHRSGRRRRSTVAGDPIPRHPS